MGKRLSIGMKVSCLPVNSFMSNAYESSKNVLGDENQSRGADAMESQWYEEITFGSEKQREEILIESKRSR